MLTKVQLIKMVRENTKTEEAQNVNDSFVAMCSMRGAI